MATIEVLRSIPVGDAATLTLRDSNTPEDCYIYQNRVMLPETITLQPDAPVHYFPEAPGHYIIKGNNGCEASLDVVATLPISPPYIANDIWFTSEWAASVESGLDETAVIAMLPEIIESDSVVYDLGANIGLYSRRFLDIAKNGYVYCFEPNPVAMHYLAHNLTLMGASNYLIMPLAISDHSGTIDLVLNPDNHTLGTSFFQKRGIRIHVSAISLDEAIERYGLRAPTVVKMDIEGGEVVAIKGMLKTLANYRPKVIFELHGREAAQDTLKHVEGYSWQIPGQGDRYTSGELSEIFPRACKQVVGTPV